MQGQHLTYWLSCLLLQPVDYEAQLAEKAMPPAKRLKKRQQQARESEEVCTADALAPVCFVGIQAAACMCMCVCVQVVDLIEDEEEDNNVQIKSAFRSGACC